MPESIYNYKYSVTSGKRTVWLKNQVNFEMRVKSICIDSKVQWKTGSVFQAQTVVMSPMYLVVKKSTAVASH